MALCFCQGIDCLLVPSTLLMQYILVTKYSENVYIFIVFQEIHPGIHLAETSTSSSVLPPHIMPRKQ